MARTEARTAFLGSVLAQESPCLGPRVKFPEICQLLNPVPAAQQIEFARFLIDTNLMPSSCPFIDTFRNSKSGCVNNWGWEEKERGGTDPGCASLLLEIAAEDDGGPKGSQFSRYVPLAMQSPNKLASFACNNCFSQASKSPFTTYRQLTLYIRKKFERVLKPNQICVQLSKEGILHSNSTLLQKCRVGLHPIVLSQLLQRHPDRHLLACLFWGGGGGRW